MDGRLFNGGRDFDISMDFRTDQLNALLLFTYSTQTEDYMLVICHVNTEKSFESAQQSSGVRFCCWVYDFRWSWRPACFISFLPVTVT